MLEPLFISAVRDLKAQGWTHPSGDNPLLFSHPEFGRHEFFNACYIQCNADKVRRRLWWAARLRPAAYNLLGIGLSLYVLYLLLYYIPLLLDGGLL